MTTTIQSSISWVCAGCSSTHDLSRLYCCTKCSSLRCSNCVCEEVVGQYCPQCLARIPPKQAFDLENRCNRCAQCPECAAPLQTVERAANAVTTPTPTTTTTTQFCVACPYCQWATDYYTTLSTKSSSTSSTTSTTTTIAPVDSTTTTTTYSAMKATFPTVEALLLDVKTCDVVSSVPWSRHFAETLTQLRAQDSAAQRAAMNARRRVTYTRGASAVARRGGVRRTPFTLDARNRADIAPPKTAPTIVASGASSPSITALPPVVANNVALDPDQGSKKKRHILYY